MKKFKLLFIGLTIALFLISCSNNTGGYEDPSNGQDPIVNPDPNGGQENPNGGQENPHDNPNPHGGNENPPAVEYTYNFQFRWKNGAVFNVSFKTNSATMSCSEFGALASTVTPTGTYQEIPQFDSETWLISETAASWENLHGGKAKFFTFSPDVWYYVKLPN